MKFGKNYCRRLARPANKLIISDHYHIAYSCYKDIFTAFIEKTKAPMKGILASMQPKLTLFLVFICEGYYSLGPAEVNGFSCFLIILIFALV